MVYGLLFAIGNFSLLISYKAVQHVILNPNKMDSVLFVQGQFTIKVISGHSKDTVHFHPRIIQFGPVHYNSMDSNSVKSK